MNREKFDHIEPQIDGASALAPDTTGWNFYEVDQGLRDILALYLTPKLLAHLTPHLSELGEMASGVLDQAANLADKHPPTYCMREIVLVEMRTGLNITPLIESLRRQLTDTLRFMR